MIKLLSRNIDEINEVVEATSRKSGLKSGPFLFFKHKKAVKTYFLKVRFFHSFLFYYFTLNDTLNCT
jgi:hypothetical protein